MKKRIVSLLGLMALAMSIIGANASGNDDNNKVIYKVVKSEDGTVYTVETTAGQKVRAQEELPEGVWVKAYDFTAYNAANQPICYKILSEYERTCEVAFPGEKQREGTTTHFENHYTYYGDVVTIPATATNPNNGKTYNVIGVGEHAFFNQVLSNNSTIIANSVKTVSDYAFISTKASKIELENAETIGQQAFDYCDDLHTIRLGGAVRLISKLLMNNSPKVCNLYVEAITPPETIDYYSQVFSKEVFERCTLYVPKSSVSTYKSTYPWNNFYKICDLDGNETENPDESLVGDLNGDGIVNIADLNMIIDIISEK